MQLYSYYRSSCSYRVRMALNLKNISYQYKAVNLLKDEHKSEAFTKLNPLQQLPVLVNKSVALSQSMAILQYLDQLGTGPKLWPSEATAQARATALCEIINSGTQPLQNLVLLNKLKSDFQARPDQIKQWNQYWILKGLQAFEQALENWQAGRARGHEASGGDESSNDDAHSRGDGRSRTDAPSDTPTYSSGPWALGVQASVVDCVLVPQVYNALRYGVDLKLLPRVEALYTRALQHPAVQAAAPENQPDAPA